LKCCSLNIIAITYAFFECYAQTYACKLEKMHLSTYISISNPKNR
jgi:hypothetical protein